MVENFGGDIKTGVDIVFEGIDDDFRRLLEKEVGQEGLKKLGRIFLAEIFPYVSLDWSIREVVVSDMTGYIFINGIRNDKEPFHNERFIEPRDKYNIDVFHKFGSAEFNISLPLEIFQGVLKERWEKVKGGLV